MKNRTWPWVFAALPLALLRPLSPVYGQDGSLAYSKDTLRVECQACGPFRVNSYLVYDTRAKEAALIDAGSEVDRLLATIESRALELKYIFLTHCHQDHVAGLPALKKRFPQARLCWSRQEFSDYEYYRDWRKVFDAPSVASWEKDPSMAAMMDFDYASIPRPDVLIKDKQTFRLGAWSVQVSRTPGHSRGGSTFSVAGVLFPGDLLLYHATGYLEYNLCSKEQIVESIRKLYARFPDEAVICSGHGQSSTIGYEREHNRNVTGAKVTWVP